MWWSRGGLCDRAEGCVTEHRAMWRSRGLCDRAESHVTEQRVVWQSRGPCDRAEGHVTEQMAMWRSRRPCDRAQGHVTEVIAVWESRGLCECTYIPCQLKAPSAEIIWIINRLVILFSSILALRWCDVMMGNVTFLSFLLCSICELLHVTVVFYISDWCMSYTDVFNDIHWCTLYSIHTFLLTSPNQKNTSVST